MELPTLQARQERGDLITMYKIVNRIVQVRQERDLITIYKIVNHIDKVGKQDLVVLKEDDGGRMRGHSKMIRKRQCLRD